MGYEGFNCSWKTLLLTATNPVPYIKQVGSFGQSQNVTGRMLATTANRDHSCFKHIAE